MNFRQDGLMNGVPMDRDYLYYRAIKNNDIEALKALMAEDESPCEVRPYDQSLVIHAVFEQRPQILNLLIAAGCDVNQGDKDRLTPLHIAAIYSHVSAARKLLEAGAEVDAEDAYGDTPLWRAVFVYEDDLAVISLLLEHGASPTRSNHNGVDPYQLAKSHDKKSVTKLFDIWLDDDKPAGGA